MVMENKATIAPLEAAQGPEEVVVVVDLLVEEVLEPVEMAVPSRLAQPVVESNMHLPNAARFGYGETYG